MKESMLSELFWDAGLFFAISALIIPLLKSAKIPNALGYLIVGIALGPYGIITLSEFWPVLGTIGIDDTRHVKMLAELGIIFLLFVIGLELTPRRLWQMRNRVFGLGGLQVIITASIIFSIAHAWGNDIKVSLLLGLSLALSSTALGIQWLHEQKLFAGSMGRSSFSILLFQDLAVIPILLLLTILSSDSEGGIAQFFAFSMAKMLMSVAIIYVIGRIILKPLFVFANRHCGAEVFMALILLIIVLSSSAASYAGLSMALGAFIAGLLLADTPYRHEVLALTMPFKSILIGIFFLSFGMGINLSFLIEKPFWLLASVIGLMTIKTVIIFALCKLWKQSNAVSVETALLLSQAGEFGLLIAGGALNTGMMEESVGQFMLLVIGFTMLLTPLIAPLARKLGTMIENKELEAHTHSAQDLEPKSQHVVIFGYGRTGKMIANDLAKRGFSIIAFDKDIERVHQSRLDLKPVYLGNALNKKTYEAASIDQAACVVITIDDPAATHKIIQSIRKSCESVPIVVRAHTASDAQTFTNLGNLDAVIEAELISTNISEKVLLQCDIKESSCLN